MDLKMEYILEDMSKDYYIDGIHTWTLSQVVGALSLIVGLYLFVVLNILPAYMKNREPYKFKTFLSFYNAFQVAFSLYVVYIYAKYLIINGLFTSKCSDKESMELIIKDIYPYFIAKHIDLLDTVFFVLRKKDSQITFLHLYHHAAMVIWTWLHLMYHPTDHFVFVGLLNSFVHVLMYAYYGISSMGPEYAKFIWWKKHLTKVQLVQFVLVVSHLYYQQKLSPCPIPHFFHYFCMTCIISFFFLFINFYFNSYKPRKTKMELSEKVNNQDTVKSD